MVERFYVAKELFCVATECGRDLVLRQGILCYDIVGQRERFGVATEYCYVAAMKPRKVQIS